VNCPCSATLPRASPYALQLRLEAENALNQVKFQGSITDQTSTPGLFVAAAPPRLVQLGARISF
jgi:hypothetical protein